MLLALSPTRRAEGDCREASGDGNPVPMPMALGAFQESRYRPLFRNALKLTQATLGLIEGQRVEAIEALPLVDATGRCYETILVSPPFVSIPPGAASVACSSKASP